MNNNPRYDYFVQYASSVDGENRLAFAGFCLLADAETFVEAIQGVLQLAITNKYGDIIAD